MTVVDVTYWCRITNRYRKQSFYQLEWANGRAAQFLADPTLQITRTANREVIPIG